MAKIDVEFQDICRKILFEGKEYHNKNRDTTRLQIPSYTLRHSFENGFPAITNKKLAWKSVVGELIWFLRGDNDVEYLNDNGIKIWNKDAYNWYQKEVKGFLSFEEFNALGNGSVGKNYSKQWRSFNGEIDQISELIKGMKKDIMSSRLKVEAWNPSEINKTALPPCHTGFQIVGIPLKDNKFGFELHWNQRSVDTFLGLPFNIASYGLLAKILELITGYKALGIEGNLKCVHLYENQLEPIRELLKRDCEKHDNSSLDIPDDHWLESFAETKGIDELFETIEIKDFILKGYTSDDPIKCEMLAPKK